MIPSRLWALAALVALAVVPWVLARHQLSLLTDLLIAGLFAMSLDLIMGYTGMVSFGHAAYFGLGAYASALVLLHFAQPVPVALLAGALLAGAVAVPVGWFSTRATGIYFAMLTLAFAQFLYTVAYKWRDLTGGSDGIAGVPKTALFWGGPSLTSPHAFYFVVATCVVVSLFVCHAVVRSPFGRALQAIRENERRFTSLGRDPRPFKLVVFVIAAAFAGLAGALLAGLQHGAAAQQAEVVADLELDGDADVFEHRELRENAGDLKRPRDAAAAPRRRGERGDVIAAEDHAAGGRRQQPRDQVEQRRLARAVRADHRAQLHRLHGEVDAGHGLQRAERAAELARLEQRRHARAPSRRAVPTSPPGRKITIRTNTTPVKIIQCSV